MWNYTGMRVKGLYLGEFPITGIVSESKLFRNGDVYHFVDLDEAIKLPFNDELRDLVVLNTQQIQEVISV
jgi:hypothetical protein